jgi:3-phenylpropionate/trans-cinnamate dioxygenase ferredoxin subunit
MPFKEATTTDAIAPGATAAVSVDGFPIAVANVDGQFHAFQNLCPHLGAALGGQPIEEGCFVTCPRHSSRYDVTTGKCVRPSTNGHEQNLLTFPTRVVGNVVEIDF